MPSKTRSRGSKRHSNGATAPRVSATRRNLEKGRTFKNLFKPIPFNEWRKKHYGYVTVSVGSKSKRKTRKH